MNDFLTPPALARRLAVKPEKVRAWILRGELEAVDVSDRAGLGRPRWRISQQAIEKFLARRSAQPPPKPVRRRRRDDDEVDYFPD